MTLQLQREPSTDGCTIGALLVDGDFFGWTCEDVVRHGPKIAHETAIPAGRYDVTITRSQRFGRMLPLLLHVPGFDGIRIHPGNTSADTSGCILVGFARQGHTVLSSRVACDALQSKIAAALARGERVTMDIVPAPSGAMVV
jgi:hypothetical protein